MSQQQKHAAGCVEGADFELSSSKTINYWNIVKYLKFEPTSIFISLMQQTVAVAAASAKETNGQIFRQAIHREIRVSMCESGLPDATAKIIY